MNTRKSAFYRCRDLCINAYESDVSPVKFKLDGNVTIYFEWAEDTKTQDTYECMIIEYGNKPLVQRISNSHVFPTELLYHIACSAESYALFVKTYNIK